MATTSISRLDNKHIKNCNNTSSNISSSYLNTVCLQDWWLIEAEKEIDGKRLAVEGLTLREQRTVRVFSSAPIIKRYDIFTLKTADGITIMIKGSINKSRTMENGFSSKVCNDFLLGFPYYWETYAGKLFEKNSVGGSVPTSVSGFDELTMLSSGQHCFGGITATTTRDHLISTPDVSGNSMLIKGIRADVLEKCNQRDLEIQTVPISADTISSRPSVMGDSLLEETPSNKEKCKSELNHEGLLHATDEEAVENEGKMIPNKKDNLRLEVFYEPQSKVPENSSIKKEVGNFTDDIPFQEKSNSERNHEHDEGLLHATADETMKNEVRLVSNKHDNLNCDSCYEPERVGLKERPFKEKLGDCNDPVLQVNPGVAKSSDVELLATTETLIDKEDGGTNEETLENVGNLLSNEQDNLNNDVFNEPESEVLEESSSKVEVEIFRSSNIEALATKETLIDKEDGGTVTLLNISKRITRNSFKKLRNYDSALGEHSNRTGFDAKLFPSMVGKGVPAEKLSTSLSEGFKKSGNSRHGKVRAVGSLKSKCTKLCSLVPQEREADKVSLLEGTISGGGKSSLPNISCDGSVEKHASTSPNLGLPNFSSKLRKCNDVKVKDDASKNLSIPKASDMNDANLSEINMVVTVDLKSPSERLGISKSSRKDFTKTKSSWKGEGSANISRSYDTGKDGFFKDASASREFDVRNVCVSEVNISGPVGVSHNYSTTSSKVRGRLGKKIYSKRKEANGHYMSGSQGYEDVPGLHVEEKLNPGLGAVIDGILKESLSTTPYAGSPKISEQAGNCSYRTMEDSTAQGDLESNVNCSTEVGIDNLYVTPKQGAATKTSDRLKNVEGKRNKNTSSNCCIENENDDSTSTLEAFEKPGRKHLIGTCAADPHGPKIDGVKETVSSCEGRRSSGRLKNLKRKDDQTTNSRLECKGNMVDSFFVSSDFVKSGVDSVDGELGGKIALDQPNVGLRATVHGKTKDKESSKDGSQMNCMISSVIFGAVENANFRSDIDSAERRDQSKSFISSFRLGDVKQTGDVETSKEREKSENSKLGTSGRKTKRKLLTPLPVTRNRRIDLCLVTPEHASYKRSRSGRLLVPPLDFWRNQQVVYDADGWIAGVQNGLPVLEFSTGSKSEPPKAKRKLI